jgi:mannosyltransferase
MTMVVHPAPDVDAGVDQPPTSWSVPFGAVLVLGVVASIVTVGRASFSLDETVSMTLADASWHRFTQTVLHREANMSLYYLLLRVWAHLGHSEAAVRTLSVLVSVGALAVIMVVARRLFDTRTALVCGLLLAVDPLVVMFAQDARGYALSLLLVSASSALFVRGVRAPAGFGTWAAYACISALAAYANFWAALVPLAHGASLAFLPPRSAPWRRIVPAGIGLGLLLVPLALLIHATDSSGVNWAAGSSAGKVFSKVRAEVPHPVIDIAVLLVVGVIVAGVVVIRRHPKTQRLAHQLGVHWSVVFALCWLVVPVAAVVLLSLVYKPLLVVRYLVICLPPFVMLVSYGLARLRVRRAATAVAAFAVLVAVSLAGLGALFAHGSPQDWRGAVATVADRAAPGDGVVIFAPYTRIPFEWYIHEHPGAETRLRPVFPAGPWAGDPLRYDSSIDVRAAAIEAAVSGYGRIWLVLSQQELYPSQEQALLAGLRSAGLVPADSRTFHGVEVVEYHRGARAS